MSSSLRVRSNTNSMIEQTKNNIINEEEIKYNDFKKYIFPKKMLVNKKVKYYYIYDNKKLYINNLNDNEYNKYVIQGTKNNTNIYELNRRFLFNKSKLTSINCTISLNTHNFNSFDGGTW